MTDVCYPVLSTLATRGRCSPLFKKCLRVYSTVKISKKWLFYNSLYTFIYFNSLFDDDEISEHRSTVLLFYSIEINLKTNNYLVLKGKLSQQHSHLELRKGQAG